MSGRPHEIDLVYSQHYCSTCRKYFSVDTSDLAPPGGRYTQRVVALAVRSVVEDGLAYRNASWRLWRDHRVFVPFATIQNWVEAGGKRATERFETDYVTWVLSDFSGNLTADKLYDGPFCVLSLVDNRTFKRLDYQVLDHDATQTNVLAFFQRFQARLAARQLRAQAITTDGSALYPSAIVAVFGDIPHQVCQFHVLADLSAAVLHAVAHVRKTPAAQQPKRRRGRPARHELPQVRQAQRLQAKIADLFTHR